jgi:NADPH:quinone reductase-like Zn-dependent oxidoreductase
MASTTPLPRKWYHYVTLDLLALVLARSVFHPFIAWLVPLCLRAVSMPTTAVEFRGACIYASLVTAAWILSALNQRAAYGRPRTLDWDEEVVLVTGGARGLGAIISQTYAMRGASVAVLDVLDPKTAAKDGAQEEDRENLKYYQCDIGNAETVERVRDQVQKDVCSELNFRTEVFPILMLLFSFRSLQ